MSLNRIDDMRRGPVFIGHPEEWDGSLQIFLHGWDLRHYPGQWYVEKFVEEFPVEMAWREADTASTLVIPATRKGESDAVKWRSLDALLKSLGDEYERSSVHVIAHSGGYFNTLKWLDDPRLTRISLLDAVYSGVGEFRDWVRRNGSHRMDLGCVHASKTHTRSAQLVTGLDNYCVYNRLDGQGFNPACRVNYIPMKNQHMSWVSDEVLLRNFFHSYDDNFH